MTVNEIREQYKMEDIVREYGFKPNRAGFIKCPFHSGDRTASLRIYKDSFFCYGCQKSGDIFKFVQLMDDCSFKEVYLRLGGTYSKRDRFSNRREEYLRKRAMRERKEAEAKERKANRHLSNLITCWRWVLNRAEPLSDSQAKAFNELDKLLYTYCDKHGIEYTC